MTDEIEITQDQLDEAFEQPQTDGPIYNRDRPFLLVNQISRPETTRADVEAKRAELMAAARAEANEKDEPLDRAAIRAEMSKIMPTPTHRPLNIGGPRHERRQKALETRQRATAVNAMRIAPSAKKAAKEAWKAPKPKLRKTRSALKPFEQIQIVDRIKPKHLASSVVIDILRGELVKHSFPAATAPAPESIVEHYLSKYMDECKTGIDRYLTRMAQKHVAAGEYANDPGARHDAKLREICKTHLPLIEHLRGKHQGLDERPVSEPEMGVRARRRATA